MSEDLCATLFDMGGDADRFGGVSLGVQALRDFLRARGRAANVFQVCATDDDKAPQARRVDQFLWHHRRRFGRILGFSCTSEYLPQALLLAERAKRATGKFVLLGGVGPSLLAGEIVRRYPFVDAVCVGEGERTLLEACERCHREEDLRGIDGLVFRSASGEVVRTPARSRFTRLDDLPIPHRALALEDDPLGYETLVHLIASRGCPGACSFCSHRAMWGRSHFALSPERLCEFLLRNGFHGDRTLVAFHDDTFLHPPGRLRSLKRELDRRGMSLRWSSFARLLDVREETGGLLRDSGCEELTVGVDGSSDEFLRGMNKPFDMRKVKRTVESLLDSGVPVRLNLIWDWPGETYRDFERMVHFVYETLCLGATVGISRLQVYPGTAIHRRIRDDLIVDGATLRALGPLLGDSAAYVWREPDLFPNFFPHRSTDAARKRDLMERAGFLFAGDQARRHRHPVRWIGRSRYASSS